MVWRPLQRRSGTFSQLLVGLWIIAACAALMWLLQRRDVPAEQEYGVSFSKLHSDELGIDWKMAYRAILEDLGVKKIRLSAHWPMIEPERDVYDFSDMDYQMRLAREQSTEVVLAVGRKSPGWPECHTPHWVGNMAREEEKMEILQYVAMVVERYKDYPNLKYWQIENEPFLNFAREVCGEPDEKFFEQELSLVRALDPDHQIIVTDGGEFGMWYKAKNHGDIFGSTMYLYVFTKHIGYWRYPIYGGFFRAKLNLLDVIGQKKPAFSMEVGLEPWLQEPIVNVSLEEQLQHMSMERFEEILGVAAKSGFAEHYLWGAEWWYYMKQNGHPEFWERANGLFE